MNLIKQTFIISILLVLNSCSNNSIDNKEVSVIADETINKEEILRLDNGQKWKIVDEMMIYLQYMQEDVNNFEGKTVEDYSSLATDLSINLDLLTSNCTMSGEAHDQLHLWLVPYIKSINDFAVSESETIAENHLNDIKNSFKEFIIYFE